LVADETPTLEEKEDLPIDVHDISADFDVANEEPETVVINQSQPK